MSACIDVSFRNHLGRLGMSHHRFLWGWSPEPGLEGLEICVPDHFPLGKDSLSLELVEPGWMK